MLNPIFLIVMKVYICNQFRQLLSIIIPIFGLACSAQIRGTVIDDTDIPVEGAAVVALQLPDSTYVGGALSDQDGKFLIENTSRLADIILRAEAIGYGKTTIHASLTDTNKIILPHSGIALKEVVVNAPKLTVLPGRFTFYPGDIIKDANDAMEVMKFVPMVRVSSGGISLLGTAPKILVNGKESIMGPSGVINMLKLSDAARVKRVEIIVQPGVARQGEGPIINLILAPRIGSMGTADLTLTYSDALSPRIQAWYGGEWEKWQFSCDVALLEAKHKNSGESTYTEFDTSLPETVDRQPSMTKYSTNRTESTIYSVSATVGASVDLGHDNSLGGSLFLSSDYSKDERHSLITIMPDASDLNTSSLSKRPFNPVWMIGRMNYDHKLDSLGSTLRASLFYQGSFKHNETSYTPLASMQGEKSATDINSIQLKGNWNKHLNDRASIDVGADAFYDNVKRQLHKSSDGSLSGELTLDDNLRQTQAQFDLFAGGEYRFSSLFSISLGVRGRWYRREIDQYVQRANRKFEDFYILPTASASFAFSPMHMVTLGYTSGIEQPEYYLTNPIKYWMSPEYYFTGNPDLKAINIHNLHLNYILLQKINLSAKGILKSNLAEQATLSAGDGVTYFKPLETGNSRALELRTGYSDGFFSHRWYVSADVTYKLTRLDNRDLPSSLTEGAQTDSRWSARLSSSITLGKDRSWTLGVSGDYQSPQHNTFSTMRGYADFGISIIKRFKFGGRLMFMASNLLNHHRSGWYDCAAYSQTFRNRTNTRSFFLKFDIDFGKPFRMRANPSSADRQLK